MNDPLAPAPPKRQNLSAYAVLVAGVAAISAAAILIRYAQGEGVPSLLIATARLTLAALFLTPFALRRHTPQLRRLSRQDWLLATASGFFLALHFATWVTSLEFTTVLVSVVLVTTTPLWVALLEVFVLRARLPRLVVWGLLIAILGGSLIGFSGLDETAALRFNDNTLLGAGLSLAGAVTVSVYYIIGRKLREDMPVILYIWLVYSAAALFLWVAVVLAGVPIVGYSVEALFWLVALATIPQLIGHSSLNYALGYLPATMVSMATQLEPIGSALLALLLFGERPLPLQIIGSAIILTGVVTASLGQARREAS